MIFLSLGKKEDIGGMRDEMKNGRFHQKRPFFVSILSKVIGS